MGPVEHGPMVCERSMVNLDGSGSLALSKGMPEHLCLRVWRIFIPKLKLLHYLDVRLSQDMVKDCDCNSLNSGRAMEFGHGIPGEGTY